MATSLHTKIPLTLMIVGLAIASVGLGASGPNQPEPAAHAPASGVHLTPLAGYLIWGGVALAVGGFMALILGSIKQRIKTSS